jgi:hypothetical protein
VPPSVRLDLKAIQKLRPPFPPHPIALDWAYQSNIIAGDDPAPRFLSLHCTLFLLHALVSLQLSVLTVCGSLLCYADTY